MGLEPEVNTIWAIFTLFMVYNLNNLYKLKTPFNNSLLYLQRSFIVGTISQMPSSDEGKEEQAG
jgi:hypothetical protein